MQPLQGHTSGITSVAFSPDGKQIVSGSRDQTIRIWNAATGESIMQPLQGHTSGITSVAFSPDGKQIVSGSWDRTIRIWNAATGESIMQPLQGHTDMITSVAFSPDGKQIVSGSYNKTIRIWDAATGESIMQPLHGHTDLTPPIFQHTSCSSQDRVLMTDVEDLFKCPSVNIIDVNKACEFSDFSVLGEDGWMRGPTGELLFWVPDHLRRGLWRPGNSVVIGVPSTKLDTTSFVHGTSWWQCKNTV
ncbi:WD40-repeat-containing domain protein [Amylocystis lapponica]|nr:WD40-repeat-containing domain protein [Amylocystis lapponica]